VIWGDDEVAILGFWIEIIWRLQRQSETAIPSTTSVAGLPGNYGIIPENAILWGDPSLPYLDDLAYLLTFPDCVPPWGTESLGYSEVSAYPPWQQTTTADSEPSEGSLGVCV
jgi:hypothetical protein